MDLIFSKTQKIERKFKMPNIKNHLQNMLGNASSLGPTFTKVADVCSDCVKAGIKIVVWLLAAFAACSAAYVVARMIILVTAYILKIVRFS